MGGRSEACATAFEGVAIDAAVQEASEKSQSLECIAEFAKPRKEVVFGHAWEKLVGAQTIEDELTMNQVLRRP